MREAQPSDSALRLAAELGLEPDVPLTVVILPLFSKLEHKISQSTEAHQRWTETNLELLKLLTSKTQETQALAESFNTLSNASLFIRDSLDSIRAARRHGDRGLEQLAQLRDADPSPHDRRIHQTLQNRGEIQPRASRTRDPNGPDLER